LLEGPSTPQATNDLAFSSLVARILHQGGLINTSGEPGRRTDKSRPRGSLIKDPSSLQWDELSLERYDEKDLLLRSFNESMANMLLASSRVDAALTTMNLRQQEYNMQVGNMRSSALMLRLAPLNLLIPYLRQVVEAGGQNVQFEVLGEETEADQEIIDVLALPLGQLLQTCLHGIPTDAEPGRVWFHARGVGNEVTLEIGFSMPVSGGALEAIREPVQRLHGTYTLQRNTAGGLNFCLRFPCSQGASQCLLVRAGSQHLLVPFSQVLRIIEESQREGLDHCYHLCDLLGFSSSEPSDDTHARPTLILSPETASQEVTGIVVDEAISEVEYIVRPLVPYLQRPGIAGAASDGRGRVLLMLDLAELVRLYATMQRDSGQSTPRYSETRQAKVLVADDSLALRRTLVQTLQQAHFSVEEAHDGMDALEKILASPPDIFLLDVEMPNLNGYDLLSMMSQYPQLSRVKTIMLSSRSSDQHIQHARELGALAYLTKPCSQHELLETIQSLLSL
ncbi:MAG: response regulator, partial [Ktedonobacteraceae bacterium]|nr:response regulator [Ktedonobacteraceae bacterium]